MTQMTMENWSKAIRTRTIRTGDAALAERQLLNEAHGRALLLLADAANTHTVVPGSLRAYGTKSAADAVLRDGRKVVVLTCVCKRHAGDAHRALHISTLTAETFPSKLICGNVLAAHTDAFVKMMVAKGAWGRTGGPDTKAIS